VVRILPIQLLAATALAVPSLTYLATSQAAQPSPAFQGRPELEVAKGAAHRDAISIRNSNPKQMAGAWSKFQTEFGGQWTVMWDDATSVPLRIFGSGIAAPGSVADPALAQRRAHDLLKRHIQLLAPGTSPSDFVLVSNELHRGIRTVGYKQRYAGMPVLGGQVSFRFKADRLVVIGSEAMPHTKSDHGGTIASSSTLQSLATKWILQDSATTAQASSVEGPLVLPIISTTHASYHTVMAVTVDGQAPLGKWRVYLDASTGERIAREQTLHFAEGTVRYDVPLRSPLLDREYLPAPEASLTVNSAAQNSSATGVISWEGINDATVEVRTKGPLVEVFTQSGPEAQASILVSADGFLDWSEAGDELLDAQLASFVHSYIAKEKVRTLNPNLSWLDTPLPVNVNIDDSCNAFSDGNSINFFIESSQCANTARLADVVYHEFGHSMHSHSIIEGVGSFDGAMSEGLSDYLSATITNDPAMGVGFFKSDAPLRHIDPASREHVWPDDVEEIHYTGLIFAGAMWDLRKLMIAQYGYEAGTALTDKFFYGAVQRSTNIPATYVEVLLEDDDDGDLANGTPNLCDINAAFGAHGLRTLSANAGNLSVVAPTLEGYEVKMTLQGLTAECPGDAVVNANIDWLLRSDRNNKGEVEMSEADDLFTGTIPAADDGEVIRYKVNVEFADGTSKTFPDNPADPRYEFYVGEIVELYCTDFETDPFTSGWDHALTGGDAEDGADDWSWGVAQGTNSNGDATEAYSGEYVVGNDLGGDNYDGLYQNDKENYLTSPTIDVGAYSDVRLQYRRWLTVEDGFFDQGNIYANNTLVWTNFNSMSESASTIHHVDREWRFHDVPLAGSITDGTVQIKYELSTDRGLQMGGWTIDDFCVVANANAICGDEELYGPEQCDEGSANANEPDACRTNCLLPTCGDGILDTGESCDDGNSINGDGCESTCLLPNEDQGDCGCVVGGSRSWSSGSGVLTLFGFLGLALLRRRRRS
jgi:cysteine-rich repeat protein